MLKYFSSVVIIFIFISCNSHSKQYLYDDLESDSLITTFTTLLSSSNVSEVMYQGYLVNFNHYIHQNDKVGLKDSNDNLILSPNYDSITISYKTKEIQVFKVRIDDNWGLVKVLNHTILPIEYQLISETSNKRYSFITKNNKVGIWDNIKEKIIIQPQFDKIFDYDENAKYLLPKDAFLRVENENKFFWIDKIGNILTN